MFGMETILKSRNRAFVIVYLITVRSVMKHFPIFVMFVSLFFSYQKLFVTADY